jgi:hypothetical protein
MIPIRTREWTVADNGSVAVLVPRYGRSGLGRWLAGRIGRPNIPVNLDEIGSAVWLACDGSTTVGEIMRRLEARFGARVDPVRPRVAGFFKELERGGLIRWHES